MLANFLNKSKPIIFIGTLILFFCVLTVTLIFGSFTAKTFSSIILESVVFVFFFLFIFFLFNFITKKNGLTFDNSYAFFIFIILSISILPYLLDINKLFLTAIYLLIVRKIYSLRSNKSILEKIYDASFWLGIFFIFKPISLIFIFLIYAAIYLHKKLTINTLVIPIIGFATPLIIYFSYLFWFNQTEVFFDLFQFKINLSLKNLIEPNLIFFALIIALLTFIFMIFKSITTLSINNTFKRSWILIILNLFVAFLFVLLLNQKTTGDLIYLFFPVAIIISNGVELIEKKIIKDSILYILFIGCFLARFVL